MMMAAVAVLAAPAFGADPEYIGPTAYTSADDSILEPRTLGNCIETFEDGSFDIPGATGNGTVVGPGGLADSVDGDDGDIDGSGTNGHSYFTGNGTAGISIEFDPDRAYGLPGYVGIVWTDGGLGQPVTFEAFNPDNQSILLTPHGPFLHADLSNSGETAEDRLYAVMSSEGIRRIVISNPGGGIEVDHLQLNRCVICGDANFDVGLSASDALIALKVSVGSDDCTLCVCDTNGNGDVTVTDALAILRKSVGLATSLNCMECS